MIKGVLLDIDGTLVLSNDAHAQAWSESFKKYGYDIDIKKIRSLIGMGGDMLISSVVPDLNVEEGIGKEITNYRKKVFQDKYISSLKPTPGARDLVKKLHDLNKKIIIATSAEKQEVEGLLKKATVNDLVNEYTTSSDVEKSKPDPDIVQAAVRKLKINADEAVMIGDTPYDIEAAHKSSVKVIALKSGGFRENDLKNADEVYNDPKDLLENLESSLIGEKLLRN